MSEQDVQQDMQQVSQLLDENIIPIPLFNFSNFFQATKLFLRLWIIEQTKHRLFRWYIKMLDYIAKVETDYGRVPTVATSTEITEPED